MTTRVLAHALRGELPGGLKLERRPVHKLVASLDRDVPASEFVIADTRPAYLIEPIILAAGTEHVLEGHARILWAERRAFANLPVVLIEIPEQLEATLAARLQQLRATGQEFDPETVAQLAREVSAAAAPGKLVVTVDAAPGPDQTVEVKFS